MKLSFKYTFKIHTPKIQMYNVKDIAFKQKISSSDTSNVYIGEHKQDGTALIVKETDEFDANLVTELILLKLLRGSKNIITLLGYQVSFKKSIILTELGVPLIKYWKDSVFTSAKKTELIKDVVNGVKQLHMRNITHNDIKPENIVVVDGVAKLIDFNIAKEIIKGDEQYLVQTIMYRAPEAIGTYRVITTAVDFWGIGCVMYELETEQILFDVWHENQLRKAHTNFFNNKESILKKCVEVDRWYLEHLHKFLTRNVTERTIEYAPLQDHTQCERPEMESEAMGVYIAKCKKCPRRVIDYATHLLNNYSKDKPINKVVVRACFSIATQYMRSDRVINECSWRTIDVMIEILNNYI